MTLKVNIEITADENGSFSTVESGIIAAITGNAPAAAAAAPVAASKPAPAAAPKAAPAAAPKAAPKAEKPAPAPASAQSTKAAVLDTTIDEEPEVEEAEVEEAEVEDDLLGGGTTYTKAEAIAAATKLVSSQKQAVVKAALAAVGAKRVSDLNDDADIQTFMAALEA